MIIPVPSFSLPATLPGRIPGRAKGMTSGLPSTSAIPSLNWLNPVAQTVFSMNA